MIKKSFLLIAAMAIATPAFALDVKKSIEVSATPDATWAAIGDFCGIGNWHPAIAKCDVATKDGSPIRTLTLKGGGTIVERQATWDNKGKSYSYAIVESPLPVANYLSTISVAPNGAGATIIWTGHFDAKGADDAKAKEVITGIYDSGLAALETKLK
jgi:Polyketide cyclase / dehydrase and lipid transport